MPKSMRGWFALCRRSVNIRCTKLIDPSCTHAISHWVWCHQMLSFCYSFFRQWLIILFIQILSYSPLFISSGIRTIVIRIHLSQPSSCQVVLWRVNLSTVQNINILCSLFAVHCAVHLNLRFSLTHPTEAGKLALTNFMKEQGVPSDPGTVMTLVDEDGNQVVLVQQGTPSTEPNNAATSTASAANAEVTTSNSKIDGNTAPTRADLHIGITDYLR